jgi:AhpD family alkylhydroperoxidase
MSTAARLPYFALAPQAYKAMIDLSAAIKTGPLSASLIDLVLLRVSQINGCAYCVDLHWQDLIKLDEDSRRLNSLAAWEESPFFDAREKAILHWTDMVTRTAGQGASDEAYTQLRAHLSEAEIAQLGFAISCMSAWNRLAISFRQPIIVKG